MINFVAIEEHGSMCLLTFQCWSVGQLVEHKWCAVTNSNQLKSRTYSYVFCLFWNIWAMSRWYPGGIIAHNQKSSASLKWLSEYCHYFVPIFHYRYKVSCIQKTNFQTTKNLNSEKNRQMQYNYCYILIVNL